MTCRAEPGRRQAEEASAVRRGSLAECKPRIGVGDLRSGLGSGLQLIEHLPALIRQGLNLFLRLCRRQRLSCGVEPLPQLVGFSS